MSPLLHLLTANATVFFPPFPKLLEHLCLCKCTLTHWKPEMPENLSPCQQVLEYHSPASLLLVGTALECVLQGSLQNQIKVTFYMTSVLLGLLSSLSCSPNFSNSSLAQGSWLLGSADTHSVWVELRQDVSDWLQERIQKLHLAVTARSRVQMISVIMSHGKYIGFI